MWSALKLPDSSTNSTATNTASSMAMGTAASTYVMNRLPLVCCLMSRSSSCNGFCRSANGAQLRSAPDSHQCVARRRGGKNASSYQTFDEGKSLGAYKAKKFNDFIKKTCFQKAAHPIFTGCFSRGGCDIFPRVSGVCSPPSGVAAVSFPRKRGAVLRRQEWL